MSWQSFLFHALQLLLERTSESSHLWCCSSSLVQCQFSHRGIGSLCLRDLKRINCEGRGDKGTELTDVLTDMCVSFCRLVCSPLKRMQTRVCLMLLLWQGGVSSPTCFCFLQNVSTNGSLFKKCSFFLTEDSLKCSCWSPLILLLCSTFGFQAAK